MRGTARKVLLAGVVALVSTPCLAGFNPFGTAGLPLDKQDYRDIAAATQPLLDDQSLPLGTSRDWSNPKSGNHGTVKLLQRFEQSYQGSNLPCRKLEYTVDIKGQGDPYNVLLDRCKTSDGSWKIF